MRVRVYKNLHKNCYSIKAMEGDSKNRVIFHATSICLSNVSFKVYESGRQRVLEKKSKNVHAYVEGEIESIILSNGHTTEYPFFKTIDTISQPHRVSYNPYKFNTFVEVDTLQPISSCHYCHLNETGVWCYNV